MTKQIGELTIKKNADYFDKVIKTLENAGFVIILSTETMTESYYIVAERKNE